MNAFEMDTVALTNMRLGTDDNTRTEYAPILLIGYNVANREIARRVIHPTIWESVALGENDRVDVSGLSMTVAQIVAVAEFEDYTADSGGMQGRRLAFSYVDNDTIAVIGADGLTTVFVKYEYVPDDLVRPLATSATGATSPPAWVPVQYHMAYVYRGMSEVYAADDDKNSAAFAQNKYEDELNHIPTLDRQTEIATAYFL